VKIDGVNQSRVRNDGVNQSNTRRNIHSKRQGFLEDETGERTMRQTDADKKADIKKKKTETNRNRYG